MTPLRKECTYITKTGCLTKHSDFDLQVDVRDKRWQTVTNFKWGSVVLGGAR